ncbi:hypothetical protein HRG_014838 [Hirsutella rhossiliensis]
MAFSSCPLFRDWRRKNGMHTPAIDAASGAHSLCLTGPRRGNFLVIYKRTKAEAQKIESNFTPTRDREVIRAASPGTDHLVEDRSLWLRGDVLFCIWLVQTNPDFREAPQLMQKQQLVTAEEFDLRTACRGRLLMTTKKLGDDTALVIKYGLDGESRANSANKRLIPRLEISPISSERKRRYDGTGEQQMLYKVIDLSNNNLVPRRSWHECKGPKVLPAGGWGNNGEWITLRGRVYREVNGEWRDEEGGFAGKAKESKDAPSRTETAPKVQPYKGSDGRWVSVLPAGRWGGAKCLGKSTESGETKKQSMAANTGDRSPPEPANALMNGGWGSVGIRIQGLVSLRQRLSPQDIKRKAKSGVVNYWRNLSNLMPPIDYSKWDNIDTDSEPETSQRPLTETHGDSGHVGGLGDDVKAKASLLHCARKKVLGEEHPSTLTSMANLANGAHRDCTLF